jgi:hypothetical protein
MSKSGDDTALFNALFFQAETLLMDLLARGFKASVAVKEACSEFGLHWATEFGVVLDKSMPGFDRERAKTFVLYLQRRCWKSMHTPHKGDDGKCVRGPSRRYLAALERKRAGQFSGRLWITDVDAVMLQMQRVAERHDGNGVASDKAQMEAIRTAHQILQQKGAPVGSRPGDDELKAWFGAPNRETESAE